MDRLSDTPESPDEKLLTAWRDGDQAAAAVLFQRYVVRLTALARSRLSRRLARRVDPEDVVLSAYRSFFVAAADGRVSVPDGQDLWPLLVVLVLRKVARNAERHAAARRDVNRDAAFDSAILSEAIHSDPTPEQAAVLEEEVAEILERLSPRDREAVSLRLQGDDERTIAAQLGCSERTVRRALERMRALIFDAGGIGDVNWPPATRHVPEPPFDPARSAAEHDWPIVPYTDLQLLELIGSGGIAKLYRARWLSHDRDVAVKFLRKRFWRNAAAVAGLLREARALQTLQHPLIVTLLGSGRTARGAAYLVLPWIDGENLEEWRRRVVPDVEQVLDTMRPVLEAVIAAHAAGLVHCDLKPSNMLRDKSGGIFLTDFGFAQSLRDEAAPFARGGTAGFVAPEQCSEAFGQIDVRTDVYGLGATYYALLCGRPPFVGRRVADVLADVVSSRRPEPPSRLCAGIPAWLEATILRCLEKDPALRFMDVEELVRNLERAGAR